MLLTITCLLQVSPCQSVILLNQKLCALSMLCVQTFGLGFARKEVFHLQRSNSTVLFMDLCTTDLNGQTKYDPKGF